jgi:hypothetical protein
MTVVLRPCAIAIFATYHTAVTRGVQNYGLCAEFLVSTTQVAFHRTHPDFQRRLTASPGVVLTIQALGTMPLCASGTDA